MTNAQFLTDMEAVLAKVRDVEMDNDSDWQSSIAELQSKIQQFHAASAAYPQQPAQYGQPHVVAAAPVANAPAASATHPQAMSRAHASQQHAPFGQQPPSCNRDGCTKPTWDGNPGFCSTLCRNRQA